MKHYFALVFVFTLVNHAIAQTEFEGNVSGEWDTEGSPYIQVGDAQVPEDESLNILPGVEVILGEEMVLTTVGLLTAIGTEDDTIRFHGPEGLVSGQISLRTAEDTIRFQYCRFDSLQNAILSDNRALSVENCLFINNNRHLDLISNWAHVTHNHFIGADEGNGMGRLEFGTINRRNGTYIFSENDIQSRSDIQFLETDNVEFVENTAIPVGIRIWLRLDGCLDVLCSGNTGVLSIHIGNTFRRLRQAIFENNQVQFINVTDQSDWGVVVRNNRFSNECSVLFAHAEFYDNVIGRHRQHQSSLYCEGSDGWRSEAVFERNLLNGVRIRDHSDVYMRNNTIWGGVAEYISGAESSSITTINNIFAYFDMEGFLIDSAIGEVSGGYNCFWGEEQPYGEDRDLLEGDIVQDPLMRGGIPYDYRLRADSPCIDAGDPESPEDPDGTRADIGCYFFDQENGEPPALYRHWDYYIGWGETFRYAAIAVDEGEELNLSFEGLPEWLGIEEDDGQRDFVRDSVVVSGEVPEDQEDFVFRVIACDDADREDTLSVRVMVYPYRVLTGVVRGVLDIERSPFIVADTAWIPAGDSLVLPPGTHLYFDNRDDSLAGRAKSMLMVMGAIKAVGTEEDSIHLYAMDRDRDNICIGFMPAVESLSEFRYCYFYKITFYYMRPENNIEINNSLIDLSSLRAGGYSIFSEVSDNTGHSGGISAYGKARVRNNRMISLSLPEPDSIYVTDNQIAYRLPIWFGSRVEAEARYIRMQNNEISGGVNATIYYPITDENFEFRNNIIRNGMPGLDVTGWIKSDITNNIILGQQERLVEIAPFDRPTLLLNNVFGTANAEDQVNIGIYARYARDYEEGFRPNLRIENNVFAGMDTLLYSYRNRTEGIRHNSLSNFGFLTNDTTFDSRLTIINANGDSVDSNFNLYLDPRIADADSLDFRLFADSPLINAGNPDSSFNDVDGSVNDIGLFGGPFGESYEYLDPDEVITFDGPPREFRVGNAYPNPFNLTANISVEVPYHGIASFLLFDIQGRRIASHSVQLTAGTHRRSISEFLNLDSSDLRSGLYLLTVEFGGRQIHRKLILVK